MSTAGNLKADMIGDVSGQLSTGNYNIPIGNINEGSAV